MNEGIYYSHQSFTFGIKFQYARSRFHCFNSSFEFEFFFECDGLVFLLWQPQLASSLEGKVLDYAYQRYHVR